MSWRIFIIICTLFFLTCQDEIQNGHNKLLPRVEKGILDLRSWDLDKDGPVPLAGDWEFYWKDFIDINLFSSSTEPKAPSFIYVPGIWNDFAVSKTNAATAAIGVLTDNTYLDLELSALESSGS